MYNEVIKDIVRKMHIIPRKLLIMYLMKKCGLSETRAANAVHAAFRNHDVRILNNDLVAISKTAEFDSLAKKRAKAFRVYLEFVKQSDGPADGFSASRNPWTISFIFNNKFIQVCNIDRDTEVATSMMIANEPVAEDDREYMRRIAILEHGSNIDRMKNVGIYLYCTVSDDYQLKVVKKCDEKIMWLDVPSK